MLEIYVIVLIMGTKHWGPPKWNALHMVGLNASMNLMTKHEFGLYAFQLLNEIPCPRCRSHYEEILMRISPFTTLDPFTWTVKVHNEVNSRLGKEEWTVPIALNWYKNQACQNTNLIN